MAMVVVEFVLSFMKDTKTEWERAVFVCAIGTATKQVCICLSISRVGSPRG